MTIIDEDASMTYAKLQHNGVHHMGMPMQGQMMNRYAYQSVADDQQNARYRPNS